MPPGLFHAPSPFRLAPSRPHEHEGLVGSLIEAVEETRSSFAGDEYTANVEPG